MTSLSRSSVDPTRPFCAEEYALLTSYINSRRPTELARREPPPGYPSPSCPLQSVVSRRCRMVPGARLACHTGLQRLPLESIQQRRLWRWESVSLTVLCRCGCLLSTSVHLSVWACGAWCRRSRLCSRRASFVGPSRWSAGGVPRRLGRQTSSRAGQSVPTAAGARSGHRAPA